jgi:DNA-binding response OmpR family regulator
MPRLDGVTVARHLCSGEPAVPVVLMSAVPSTEAPAEVPVLPKPFTVDHLLQVITAALTRSRHRE